MAELQSKTCRVCGQVKPASSFYRHPKTADRLQPFCKDCQRLKSSSYYLANAEKLKAKASAWYKAQDPTHLRKKAKARVARYRKRHPERAKACLAKWRESHRKVPIPKFRKDAAGVVVEKLCPRCKAWLPRSSFNARASRPDGLMCCCRACYQFDNFNRQLRRLTRKASLPYEWSPADTTVALTYFGNECAVCDTAFGPVATLHWDHWIPLNSSTCPGTVPLNMVPLCDTCNLQKSDSDAAVWLASKFTPTKAARVVARINRFFDFIRR